ncbi:MetQ/NlpA family ABC transporter substrate-binding protein [Geomicrobium sediminis]|uniref:D-methionine transport system substrate-binding protein n=1 Tax=Geomicrobium sediminis TaxID=1347788 RepID=A0ABS2PA35_9BACL|nr:MetQ/NlpA family ABC transporter substrate-binding protein [Geomicrobium sediminis]MBM7632273.1 D-methionine transport system substrate-binding protein [Geomicrobium sediminis]
MRKQLGAIVGGLLILTACSGEEEAGGTDDQQDITIGATAGPYSDMLSSAIVPGLEEKGYNVDIQEFSDYVYPNNALANEEIDANLFQHTVYLENFTEQNNLDLVGLIAVPTAPMGLYSEAYETIEDIENGDEIAIPNDPTNAARAFMILEEAGLIGFEDGIDELTASARDITDNPLDLQFVELEAAQLPRQVGSSEITAVPGNFALSANLDLLEALELEDMPDQYRNVVAVRAEDEESTLANDIVEVIQSEQFEETIDEEFEGFGKPEWME